MPRVHLIEGPVGAGKSTFAATLAARTGGVRALLAAGTDVILELGLIQREPRMAFCRTVTDAGIDLVMVELDAPRALRRARVQRRNVEQGATFSMVVPDAVFELASDLWEPVDDMEREVPGMAYLHVASEESGGGGHGA